MPHTYLFALTDGGGTVPVEVGSARRLVGAGHRVTVIGEPTTEDAVTAAGAHFQSWRTAPQFVQADIADWECATPVSLFARLLDRLVTGPSARYAADVREVAAEYWQARIVGREVAEWQTDPALVAEHAGCSLVLLGRRYYAIPVSDGAFRLDRYRRRGYSFQAEAATLQSVSAMAEARSRDGQHRF